MPNKGFRLMLLSIHLVRLVSIPNKNKAKIVVAEEDGWSFFISSFLLGIFSYFYFFTNIFFTNTFLFIYFIMIIREINVSLDIVKQQNIIQEFVNFGQGENV